MTKVDEKARVELVARAIYNATMREGSFDKLPPQRRANLDAQALAALEAAKSPTPEPAGVRQDGITSLDEMRADRDQWRELARLEAERTEPAGDAREWKRIAKEAETRANFLAEIIRDCPEARDVWGKRIADEAAGTLAALSASVKAAPGSGVAGWKLVPVEPDDAMIEAAFDALNGGREWDRHVSGTDVWAAMLAASPSPPETREGGRSQQFLDGQRSAEKCAVQWLHDRANAMNDPHAKQVLDSAAFNMGADNARAREAAKSPTPEPAGEDDLLAWIDSLPKEPSPALRALFADYRKAIAEGRLTTDLGPLVEPAGDVRKPRPADAAIREVLLEAREYAPRREGIVERIDAVLAALSASASAKAAPGYDLDSRIDMAWADGAKAAMNALSGHLPDNEAVRAMDRRIAERQAAAIAGRSLARAAPGSGVAEGSKPDCPEAMRGTLPIWKEGWIAYRLSAAMHAYLKEYVYSPDEGWDHEPTEFERGIMEDMLNGALSDETVTALLQNAAAAMLAASPSPPETREGVIRAVREAMSAPAFDGPDARVEAIADAAIRARGQS